MKRIEQQIIALCFFALLAFMPANAKVKLPVVFSDGMVVQRERPVTLWGTADKNEEVQVQLLATSKGKKAKTYTTTADEEGKWNLVLPAMKAGGPYDLSINQEVMVRDILVGDLWLCSGQSNMELPVRRVTDMFAEEIASYVNDRIREFKVPNQYNFHGPQSDVRPAVWKKVEQPAVMDFSALAYFFAKAYYEATGVPVGIVNSSWGGTPVESWMSEEAITPFPKYLHDLWRYQEDEYLRSVKATENYNFSRWNGSLHKGDAGLHEQPRWYSKELDDSSWEKVDMFSSKWATNGLNPVNGSHWFRKTVEIPASWEGKEAVLRLGCIVDADSVYVNGTFVGTVSYQYPPRIYKVPAGLLTAGRNVVTIRLISDSGMPHFVKEKPYKLLCDGQEVSLEGEWNYHLGCVMPPSPSMEFYNYKPVGLYNAMIAPLIGLEFKGVIWYQGEANVAQRNEYKALLSAMIADWRKAFHNEELPFYLVELADFLSPDDIGGRKAWAEFRTVQAETAEANEHVTLIKNSDLGEWNDIHPLDKKTLAGRVLDAVLKDTATKNTSKK